MVAVIVILGFLAGVVGELWINGFLMPDPYLNFKRYSDLSKKIDDLIVKQQDTKKEAQGADKLLNDTVEKIRPTVVKIYKYKKFTNKQISSLLPDEFLGLGTIVTNDGWIITNNLVSKNEKDKYFIVTNENKIFESQENVRDQKTGVVFLKIAANNLSVIDFSLKYDTVNGQQVFLFGAGDDLQLENIDKLNYFDNQDFSSYLHKSEVFYKYIHLGEALPASYLGSPVVTLNGKMIGLYSSVDGLVLPVDYFKGLLKNVGKNEIYIWPYLGINFYDLSEIINPDLSGNKGALINSIKDINVDSPAKGILLTQDIILKVENEEVNANKNLVELLMQYRPDEKINLTVKRGTEEKVVEVQLGKAK